ncbi:MAG TPA: very short patch repair endonuclease [Bryobacteraceae bacterium]|nr:very short patch repair endonuclease [Bryobacteraceae bacterium]
MDVLTPEQRRLNMSRIRGANTKPEILLRSALHASGLRFRLHRRDLPGAPDIVFPGARVAVFVDGCFWHGCPSHGARPKTNREFWSSKLAANRRRDLNVNASLKDSGWTVLRFWEHEVKRGLPGVVRSVVTAVRSGRGRP